VIHPALTKTMQQNICQWFDHGSGRIVLDLERQGFARLTEQLFGYHLLQLGWLDENQPMMVNSQLTHQFMLGQVERSETIDYLTASFEQLPLMTDTIDAVVLPHTLDFCQDPQQVLREVERILIPEGRVLISGFNPVSFSGIRRYLFRHNRQVPWNGHFVSYTRLQDWLSLLGFEVEMTEVQMFRPLLQNQRFMQKLEFMEKTGSRLWPRFGSVYLIRAVKRVSTLTPIKPVWKRRPRLLTPVVEPSTRGLSRSKELKN